MRVKLFQREKDKSPRVVTVYKKKKDRGTGTGKLGCTNWPDTIPDIFNHDRIFIDHRYLPITAIPIIIIAIRIITEDIPSDYRLLQC